jgi:hypothetical protein
MKTKYRPAAPLPPVEDDERHADETDAFITRNRDALNDSLRRSRKEIADGKVSKKTVGEIISEGRARHATRK